jgi:hypothetical protein
MDCSDIAAPVISYSTPFSACKTGESLTFTATPSGDYKWQISSDNGTNWTDVAGTGFSNSIEFNAEGNYLVRAANNVCKENFSSALPVQALTTVNPLEMDALNIMTLNNVIYSYQYTKLATYVAPTSGTVLGYQWYMKYTSYDKQGSSLSTKPAKDEATDIIVGATQSSYTFDPYSDPKYLALGAKAGTYYFYCKAFGKNSSNVDVVSLDSILVRVEDLYDASRSNLLITKEQWKEDSLTNEVPGGQLYFIPVLYSSANDALKIAHANLGSAKTRDAGELGNLYQWARDEDGHERRQYDGRYSNWANLEDTATFVSPLYSTQASGQASGNAFGKFIYSTTRYNWTSTNYSSGWGIHDGTTDPCKSRNSNWRIPSGKDDNSDWVKLTLGTSAKPYWSSNKLSGRTNQNSTLFLYPWSSRYTAASTSPRCGSMTIVSNISFDGSKRHVAILPASGYRINETGLLYSVGSQGIYWSSTSNNLDSSKNYLAFYMFFSGLAMNTISENINRASGYCVRCVAEF